MEDLFNPEDGLNLSEENLVRCSGVKCREVRLKFEHVERGNSDNIGKRMLRMELLGEENQRRASQM